jgi:hypothetical protein
VLRATSAARERLNRTILIRVERTLPRTLQDFFQHYPSANFPVVVVCNNISEEVLPPFVKAIFSTDFDQAAFNEEVGTLLKLPTRRSARLPLRLGVCLAHHAGTQIANTVNICATGMPVEAFKPLTVGKVYEFRFICRGNGQEQPVL